MYRSQCSFQSHSSCWSRVYQRLYIATIQLPNIEAENVYLAAMNCMTQAHTVKHYSFHDLPEYVTFHHFIYRLLFKMEHDISETDPVSQTLCYIHNTRG
jgi:hypothetical protein